MYIVKHYLVPKYSLFDKKHWLLTNAYNQYNKQIITYIMKSYKKLFVSLNQSGLKKKYVAIWFEVGCQMHKFTVSLLEQDGDCYQYYRLY